MNDTARKTPRGAGIAIALTGVLTVLTPRYILPVCEFVGRPVMHCSETARWEMALGAAIVCAGAALIAVGRPLARAAIGLLVVVGGGMVVGLPEVIGYCASPRMPCHYGAIPAMRILGVVTAIIGTGVILKGFKRRSG